MTAATEHDPADDRVPPSIVIGFGHAGRMHARCIDKARQQLAGFADRHPPTFVIDTALKELPADFQSSDWRVIGSLNEVPREVRRHAVAHICTPPSGRARVIHDALAAGIDRLIVEKPMASTPQELAALAALRASYGADLLVVANWTASNLTREIQSFVGRYGSVIKSIRLRQQKCRISRTKAGRDGESAFEVEVPHMMALAQLLAGPELVVRQARTWDMVVEGRVIPQMGGAELTLDGRDGVAIEMRSDHLAPAVERSVRIEFCDGGRLEGYYPCSSLDNYSQFKTFDADGRLLLHKYIEDDTLTRFFVEAYSYFLHRGAKPTSDFEFNTAVCALLHEARRLSVRGRSSNQRTQDSAA